MSEPALELRAVCKRYPARPGESEQGPLLRELELTVLRGEFVAIEGQSGSGKSSLLHILGALDRDFSGEVRVLGQSLAALGDSARAALRNRSIGFVFQSFNLLPQLSALENVLLPQAFNDAADREANARAREALAEVGLAAKSAALPGQLSGGERQRIAIARALLKRAPILLLDEATSALDSESEALIQGAMQKAMQGRTVIAIAHRLSTIAHLDRLIVLADGKVIEDGSHAGLLERGGLYARLWRRQSEGFLRDDDDGDEVFAEPAATIDP